MQTIYPSARARGKRVHSSS